MKRILNKESRAAIELMIGDWVLYDNQPHQIRQLGIFGENRDGEDYPAVCVGKPNGIGLILERNEIEPIPLTPEILEKNEFTSQPNIGYIIDDYDGMQIIYDDWNHNLRIIKNYKVCLDIETFDVISVHELQHALRFCGIEKEITL